MEKEKFTIKNPQHRELLAHLGLAADRSTVSGDCPDEEAFAGFLEMGPGSDDYRKMLDHVSTCESCYQKWLILSEGLESTYGKKKARLHRSRKLMTAAGSVCAVACGVMLYLAIDYQPMMKTDLEPDSERSIATSSSARSSVIEQKEEAEDAGAAPAPMVRVQEVSGVDDQIAYSHVDKADQIGPSAADSNRVSGQVMSENQSEKMKRPGAAVPARKSGEQVIAGDVARDKSVETDLKTASPVLRQAPGVHRDEVLFLEQFITLCGDSRENRLKQSSVEKLLEQGRSLPGTAVVSTEELVLIDEIMELLEGGLFEGSDTFSHVCERAVEGARRNGYNVRLP